MKYFFTIILIGFILILGISNWPRSNTAISQYLAQRTTIILNGEWRPDVDPAVVGINDFTDMQNMRYYGGPSPKEYRLEGVPGYNDITTTPASGYVILSNGIQFKKDNPPESHVLTYGQSSGNTESGVYIYDVAIPGTGEFGSPSGISIFQDSSGADIGRFSPGPMQHIVYSNSKDLNQIWGGDEMPVAAFITSAQQVTEYVVNPKDYTIQVNNTLDDAENVALIGGGNDSPYTKSLLHFGGPDGSQPFTESATGTTETRTWNVDTTAALDIDQRKFGTAAGYFPSGASIYAADSVDWHLAQGDGSGNTKFTVEFWVRFNSISDSAIYFMEHYTGGADFFIFQYDRLADHDLEFKMTRGGAGIININVDDWEAEIGRWYHFAVTNGWGGILNDYAFTIDGVAMQTETDADTFDDQTGNMVIGGFNFDGHIDEFRWSKGIARWTSNFNPPTREYGTAANTYLIGVTRALSGISVTVKDINSTYTSGQSNTMTFWNGASWTSLPVTGTTGFIDNTSGLTSSGRMTWPSTVNTAKPKYLQGRLLYWYQGNLPNGEASISHVSVDAPWQPMVDLWDHVPRQPIKFMALNYSSGVEEWDDWTLEVNADEPFYEFGAQLGGQTTFVVIFQDRIQGLLINMISGSTVDSGSTPFYWNGESYAASGVTYDSTESLLQSGHYTWTPPEFEEEFPREQFGVKGYTYKFEYSEPFDSASDTDGTVINTVYGIPAPLSLKPFKFTFMLKGRLFKCNYAEGNQGNRCDYTEKDAPDTWNGEESSANRRHRGPLFFGDGGELLAGTELYNRYGSKTYSWGLLIARSKTFSLEGDGPDNWKIYVVNENIGIVAPLTLATAVMTYAVEGGELDRLVAMWLDFSGPIMFDGSSPRRIKGIDSYFNPNHANYLGSTDISNARAWFSRTYQEYNLRIGDSFWVAYDTKRKRWYPKSTQSQPVPQFGMEVVDTEGTAYTYSGCTDGYLRRMDYGTTWDGTGIEQILQTGEFRLNNDAWQDTLLKEILLENVVLSEVATLNILHYKNTATSGQTVEGIPLDSGTFRTARTKLVVNESANRHKLKMWTTTSGTTRGWRPLELAIESETKHAESPTMH